VEDYLIRRYLDGSLHKMQTTILCTVTYEMERKRGRNVKHEFPVLRRDLKTCSKRPHNPSNKNLYDNEYHSSVAVVYDFFHGILQPDLGIIIDFIGFGN
jgi:hypothetical protein